jgi:hypothetical protein
MMIHRYLLARPIYDIMSSPPKRYPTLGCCGLDCGLCPRYYTKGDSRCPGCQGPDFSQKHPSCKILTCCFKKQGLECCGDCKQFPCDSIKPWASGDSFISHQVCLENLKQVQQHGIEVFVAKHQKRIELLRRMIDQFDDGRSRNLFCLAAALLPPEQVEVAIAGAAVLSPEKALQAKKLKALLVEAAGTLGIVLALRK